VSKPVAGSLEVDSQVGHECLDFVRARALGLLLQTREHGAVGCEEVGSKRVGAALRSFRLVIVKLHRTHAHVHQLVMEDVAQLMSQGEASNPRIGVLAAHVDDNCRPVKTPRE
jgi:hypothetical protein